MRKSYGLLSVCLLLLSVACGGKAAAVTGPTNVPPVVPTEAAPPSQTVLIASPTATVSVSTATLEIPPAATETAQPTSTVLSPTSAPSATASTAAPTDTPAPSTAPTTAVPTDTPALLTTPATAAPTAGQGNADNGNVLFAKMGCKSCHMPSPGTKRIAPDLTHILTDAEQFIHLPDYKGTATDAPGYIRESIVLPNIFVVPAFRYLTPDGSTIMPRYFGEQLTPAEIDDLVAYVLSLP